MEVVAFRVHVSESFMDGFCDGGFAASRNAHHHYVNAHVALLAIDDPVPLRTRNKTTINRKSSISQIKSTTNWKIV